MKTIIITKQNEGQRIDKVVRKYLETVPLGFIYKLFRKKDIKINGKKADIDYVVKENDEISIYLKEELLGSFAKVNVNVAGRPFAYPVVYEDGNILIVDKPRGIIVNNPENSSVRTLQQEVISYLVYKGEFVYAEGCYVPEPAHRLDRNTSGLVIFAKTMPALQELMKLFKEKENLDKYYLVLVKGRLTEDGEINKPLKKDSKKSFVKIDPSGRETITQYKINTNYLDFTLLQVKLVTGFTHQIRVHLQSIEHPVIGDQKYGDFTVNMAFKKLFGYENQFLHAYKLVFKNMPEILKNIENTIFTSPLPEEEENILKSLRQ